MKDLFTVSGRISRGRYAFALFIELLLPLTVIYGIFAFMLFSHYAPYLHAFKNPKGPVPSELMVFFMLHTLSFLGYLLLAMAGSFILAIKRLRDISISPWLCLILFVPVIAQIFTIYLLAAPTRYATQQDPTLIYPGDSRKRPAGMMFILIMQGLGILSTIFVLLSMKNASIAQIGPYVLRGLQANIFQGISLILSAISFYCILQRKEEGYMYVLTFFSYSFVLMLVNLIYIFVEPQVLQMMIVANGTRGLSPEMAMAYGRLGAVLALVGGLIFGLIYIIYIQRHRSYFDR